MDYVLDTNIVSFIIGKDSIVKARFNQINVGDNLILACPMVWYEIRRGLLSRHATAKMVRAQQLFSRLRRDEFRFEDWSLAAELWAQRRAVGRPISDADLLIAVFAINRNAILVTDNTKDFSGLDVHLENWR